MTHNPEANVREYAAAPAQDRRSIWTGEFLDRMKEGAFRQEFYDNNRRQVLIFGTLILAALGPVGYAEYLNAGDREGFGIWVAGHLFSGLLSVILVFGARRRWSYRTFDLLLFTFIIYVIVESVFLIRLYQEEVIVIAVRLPLYAIIGNVLVTMSGRHRIIWNIAGATTFIGALWWFKPLDDDITGTISVVIGLASVFGFTAGTWLGGLRRIEFENRRGLQEANAALVLSKRQAEEATEAKSMFLSNISHELRTPLNAIIGYSEALQGQIFGPLGNRRYNEYVTDINDSGRQLLDLINDLLDLNRLEAGKADMSPEWTLVEAELQNCIKLVEAATRETGQQPVILDVGKDFAVLFDTRAMRQIIINLLTNARKYAGNDARISVHAELTATGARIVVSDTGGGIDTEAIERLLRPFEQVDASTSRPAEGWGLGLPLANSLAEANRSSLTIESTPGQGTSVMLTIPAECVRRDFDAAPTHAAVSA